MRQTAGWLLVVGVAALAFGVFSVQEGGREERLGWALEAAGAALLLAGAIITHGRRSD